MSPILGEPPPPIKNKHPPDAFLLPPLLQLPHRDLLEINTPQRREAGQRLRQRRRPGCAEAVTPALGRGGVRSEGWGGGWGALVGCGVVWWWPTCRLRARGHITLTGPSRHVLPLNGMLVLLNSSSVPVNELFLDKLFNEFGKLYLSNTFWDKSVTVFMLSVKFPDTSCILLLYLLINQTYYLLYWLFDYSYFQIN